MTENAFSRYAVSDSEHYYLLDDDFDLTKAANLIVNPLTAITLLNETKRKGSKAVI
jgi:NADPH:quinone reductase-like Zn-dependent oxidoreductase